MRDHEMVKRASLAHSAWAWWTGATTRTVLEMMADFAAAEVARARSADGLEMARLSGRLERERDAAVARAEKAEAFLNTQVLATLPKGFAYPSGSTTESVVSLLSIDWGVWRDRAIKAEQACAERYDLWGRAEARADQAEARVRELEEAAHAKPAPYVPKVGDRVLWAGEREFKRVVVGVDPLRLFYLNTRCHGGADPIPGAYTYDGPATPAERAAAGLPPEPPEAPAAPQVLPEHLAYLEAMAFYGASSEALALLAAVARRDGGGK